MKVLCGSLLLFAMACAAAAAAPQVTVESGRLSGDAIGDVETFLGIPYAAAPVGQLRWRAPQRAPAWEGVRKAIQFGNDCMQEPFPSDAAPLGAKPAEDCLFINVWRPTGKKKGDRLPVLVWIHGGGMINGGGSPAVYSGDSFARHGVMFVSFNYRLGRFGFFAFPELTRQDADHGMLANYGNMDAIAAMQWVQRNIAAFGGDPAQVTVYGQSGGAQQVFTLLASPLADGLFARAIVQSGGGAAIPRQTFQGAGSGPVTMEAAGVNFARRWDINGTGAEALKQLRALSAEKVTDGLHIGTASEQGNTFVQQVLDGHIVSRIMVDAVAAGKVAKVPLLIGSTTGDNYNSLKAKSVDEALATTFASVAERARAAYLTDPSADPQYVLREMGRDYMYAEPHRFIAAMMTAQGVPVYEYRFGYVASSMRQEWTEGPLHATDIPFSMNTLSARYGDKLTSIDRAMGQMTHMYWVNFVRTGDPNGPGLPHWPLYDPGADVLMEFSTDGMARAIPDPHKARLDSVAAVRGH
jgi:para-nitrobenzyl esterase